MKLALRRSFVQISLGVSGQQVSGQQHNITHLVVKFTHFQTWRGENFVLLKLLLWADMCMFFQQLYAWALVEKAAFVVPVLGPRVGLVFWVAQGCCWRRRFGVIWLRSVWGADVGSISI